MKKLLFALYLMTQITLQAKEYKYESYPQDPLKTRIYKLDNGLTVFLSQNKLKPRIHSYIAVRAGSSYDPADNTGLAHYLEHMLFKGTPKYGTKDWKKEELILKQISDLFEKHKAEKDPAKKKRSTKASTASLISPLESLFQTSSTR